MVALSMMKEARIHNGEKTISSISSAGKTESDIYIYIYNWKTP